MKFVLLVKSEYLYFSENALVWSLYVRNSPVFGWNPRMNMLLSGVGVFDRAIQNSPCVSTVKLTLSVIVASTGSGVVIPKVPLSLKLLTPKLIPSLEAAIPNPGTLAASQFPAALVSIRSRLLEMTCQRSRQLIGGETGVGVGEGEAVSVGVGDRDSVGEIIISVGVGDEVVSINVVAVAGRGVRVGSSF